MKKQLFISIFSMLVTSVSLAGVTDYVDPRIGSEGLGRVVVGPSCPFGMVKPSPDCTSRHNSGWAPMPEQVDGFSQTHVSGTGGGPKYGNILLQPYCGKLEGISHPAHRQTEEISLGYYGTIYDNGINVEVTTSQRAIFYRVTYPEASVNNALMVDAGWFLGENPLPDTRESQQFVGSEIQILSDTEIAGYTRIRGGWNNGRAYTVYFYIESDQPFADYRTWHIAAQQHMVGQTPELTLEKETSQFDRQHKTGALVSVGGKTLNLKVGISFISSLKARDNAHSYLPTWNFDDVRQDCVAQWDALLSKIDIEPLQKKTLDPTRTAEDEMKMFYTGLYHTMLEPVDRTGENPLWFDPNEPYYDDFYAIWDTYRTSSPLITLIDEQRQIDIVRSLINIGKRDGYMPDARSGNSNGRTQGGSNAEIVLADAYVKHLGEGQIDWSEALKQMLKDATLPPGGNEEAEGRGGLTKYLELGYVPYGIDRSGNRTMEYAFCDYAIAVVAKGMGYTQMAEKYMKMSENWKNLWRSDYEHAGTRGFIMPRAANGEWLDELVVGHSKNLKPTFIYTPVSHESPWYTAWWGTVFYEATSWEYSLSVPHDVPGLIEQCGGVSDFERRLDTFFDKGFYNVNNEPSFLTPCLYHWIGRPDRTGDRVRQIISKSFNATGLGLPGNDDSGAMSSWLAFHMMGIYPNAGTDYYLIHTPLLKSSTMHLCNGKDFTITAPKLSDKNLYIVGAKLNGVDYDFSSITHDQIMQGGTLELIMGKKPAGWGKELSK